MISDEPGEDADSLEDDKMMEAYLGDGSKEPADRSGTVPGLPEWPPLVSTDVALSMDAATIAWFKANHADWRRQVRLVLHAWIAAHSDAPERPEGP
jgi:hypothetical protein